MGRPNTTGLDWRDPDYQRKWAAQNREKVKEYRRQGYEDRGRKKWRRRLYWIYKYKTSKGCVSCGYNQDGVALDFDHLKEDEKLFSVGTRIPSMDLKKLFTEIRKCQILCANCHRIKTYRRLRDNIYNT